MLFYYLDGTVSILDAGLVVIDCGGVGFECATTRYTQSQVKVGQKVRLFTSCSVREDAIEIYGFCSREELRCFQQLIGISGVGPKAALSILSTSTPDSFRLAVLTGDEKTITAAPGVGKKLAQRIILELKDKIAGEQIDFSGNGTSGGVAIPTGSRTDEALAALQALGYSASESASARKGADENLSVEELVRYALRAMVLR